MVKQQLRELWRLPQVISAEIRTLTRELFALRTQVLVALQPRPAVLLVLLQGRYSDGEPFLGAMSGRLINGCSRLTYTVQRPLEQLSVLVFCDLEALRIDGIMVGGTIVLIGHPGDSAAPLAYVGRRIMTGERIFVEFSRR